MVWFSTKSFTVRTQEKKNGKIHKGGNKHIRRALTLACTNIYARGDITNPIHTFIKKKYEQKDIYWLAICAGSRKLLSIMWLLLNYQKGWKPDTVTDPEIFNRLQKVIDFKIKGYNSKIANYQKLQEKLTELMNKDLSELDKSVNSIKQLKSIFNLVL